jgi:coenzyme F420-0:L-glutamate ligase/coenzyme F420-1:gamma-L-glutamate ligase
VTATGAPGAEDLMAAPAVRPPAGALLVLPVRGIPEVGEGADVAALILAALGGATQPGEPEAGRPVPAGGGPALLPGDVVVVTSKLRSKAEGAIVGEAPVPGAEALALSRVTGIPSPDVQLILDQSVRVVRSGPGVLVTETRHGFVCANSGVDRSNAAPAPGSAAPAPSDTEPAPGSAVLVEDDAAPGNAEPAAPPGWEPALLLPADPDAWARAIRAGLEAAVGGPLAVLVSDSFGRPFRNGQVNVALGASGMRGLRDYRGLHDPGGHRLRGTELAVADELCAAAELVMNKLDRVPVAIVRGFPFEAAEEGVGPLLRDPAQDLFR